MCFLNHLVDKTKMPDFESFFLMCIAKILRFRFVFFTSVYFLLVQTSCGVGKVELSMKKKSITKWKELGLPLDSHDLLLKSKDRGVFTEGSLLSVQTLSFLFTWHTAHYILIYLCENEVEAD